MKALIAVLSILISSFGYEATVLPIKKEISDINSNIYGIKRKVRNIKKEIRQIKPFFKDLKVKVSEKEIKITISSDVLFDFDSAELRDKAKEKLSEIADFIKKYGAKEVLIEGHTDSKGSEKYNLKLSEKRAASVKKWLIENGNVNPYIIKTVGYGESRPIAPNTNKDGSDNPQGRQKNRRVEITAKRAD